MNRRFLAATTALVHNAHFDDCGSAGWEGSSAPA